MLNLSHNRLGVTAAAQLAKALVDNRTLQTLMLDRNPLGRSGVTLLLQTLDGDCTVTRCSMLQVRLLHNAELQLHGSALILVRRAVLAARR